MFPISLMQKIKEATKTITQVVAEENTKEDAIEFIHKQENIEDYFYKDQFKRIPETGKEKKVYNVHKIIKRN